MIHLSKHSRGSVRSGSHSADRCLSISFYLCPDKTHTSKVNPDFVLEQSTQRLNEAALYGCMSDRAVICVRVCVWTALTVYHSAYQTSYCQFLFVALCLCLPFGICDLGVETKAHTEDRAACSLLTYCLSFSADSPIECQTDSLHEIIVLEKNNMQSNSKSNDE